MMNGLDMKGLMEAWQKVQGEVGRAKEELGGKLVTGETGGGMVRCVANGRAEVVSIEIDPALFASGDKKMIEDLAVGAVNVALEKAHAMAQETMARATTSLPIPPGLFKE
jgi:DNA-binding YbaB/EbfC family protein